MPEVCAGARKKIMLAENAEKLRTVFKTACPWALMCITVTVRASDCDVIVRVKQIREIQLLAMINLSKLSYS